ncbi:predicted permease [Weissella oryzae SG25]|uniref:Probable membrane transporter protein n=1 Tax=Weissella oryzae (strain DSM 25784 / JCM 18191 / LMG 30913 / SG25) TaxID=1329250 RepID=A0A069CW13_WEIOS|nr:sulfite exporter TauE/SafE family protein [Weissella oryzae]GAK31659.1 predicted permease [Weissella oryzae SG25]
MLIIVLGLFIAGIAAGVVSTLVGMASLISYPVLLAVGLPPVTANVTNTAALTFTGLGVGVSSRYELRTNYRDLYWILPLTVLGSLLGSFLLVIFPSQIFEKIVPFLVLMAAIVFLIRPYLHANRPLADIRENVPIDRNFIMISAVFLISIYGGYFGAASGVFTLLAFTMTAGLKYTVANAVKNISGAVANLVATIIYAFYGNVNWGYALPMGAGFVIGGWIGPKVARSLPAETFRWLIILGAFVLSGYLFYKAYL